MNNCTPLAWKWSKPVERRSAFFPFAIENEINRLVRDVFGTDEGANGSRTTWKPAMTVDETKEHYLVTAEVPGIPEKELDISLVDGVLTVSGEKKEEIDRTVGKNHFHGRKFGTFSQQVFLEAQVDEDKIDATVKDGVLTIKLPKSTTSQEKVKKISVRAE